MSERRDNKRLVRVCACSVANCQYHLATSVSFPCDYHHHHLGFFHHRHADTQGSKEMVCSVLNCVYCVILGLGDAYANGGEERQIELRG